MWIVINEYTHRANRKTYKFFDNSTSANNKSVLR